MKFNKIERTRMYKIVPIFILAISIAGCATGTNQQSSDSNSGYKKGTPAVPSRPRGSFNEIEIGMPSRLVREILGKPTRVRCRPNELSTCTWYYRGWLKNRYVRFKLGKVSGYE